MSESLSPLGEFEAVVLMAVLHAGDEASGSVVLTEIERRGGRPVARGAVYVTLDRLEDKGLLASKLVTGSADRGNRPRRVFRVTARGLAAIRRSLALVGRMRRGLDPILGDI